MDTREHPSPFSLAGSLTDESVQYSDEQFELRAGGLSNWYVDLRRGLCGRHLAPTGAYVVAQADALGFEYEVVSAIGVGGSAVQSGVAFATRGRDVVMSYACDKHEIDEQGGDQYGLHADVKDKRVWLVDDTGSSGSSLITLANMVFAEGGIIEHASVVVDRSKGKAPAALAKLGIAYHALFEFSEETGALAPIW